MIFKSTWTDNSNKVDKQNVLCKLCNMAKRLFPYTTSKLEDSAINLERMRSATDSVEFKAAFTAFLSSARAITYALQEEGAHIEGFKEWYSPFSDQMKKDPLLRFIHNARIEDFHKAKPNLKFRTFIKNMQITIEKPGSVVIGAEGPFRIVNEGTPKEKRIPIKEGEYVVQIFVKNLPKQHLGQTIEHPNPVVICELALEYYESLIHKAKTQFSSK